MEQIKEELARVRGILEQIGNAIGAPTMAYAPEMERRELLRRVDKVSKLVQEGLTGAN